ncbi:amino acid ABC transporter permease [Bradyrhizobium sp. CCGUVB1N3]|uniref:amino acid ABC transporter permease n=1 Tax=Bradyrhizobium sp. CCGUVB1N3 TaxID=2949629 RepID=UPI0020B36249|nr:amino acid ABC transporter permease [Bradyrhizobium sp. CCGUVB1N3]MCP3474850.1 amino acid ABC transporter permease [Bradyrhizobium sp. CCGUVB1N3]
MNNWVWPIVVYLGQGLLITLWISLLTVVLATMLGLVIAALSQSTLTSARLIGRIYVDVFRGVPSLMILLFVFFALPQIGLRTGPLTAAVIGLGLWGGANIGEVFRGALNSIPHRQEQGARALGLSATEALVFVILPQAFRRALPPYVGQLTVLVQASALTSVVGVSDLLGSARQMIERLAYVGSGQSHAIEIYLGVLGVFFVICYALTALANAIERRLRY